MRYVASSTAESPPPTTTSSLSRNLGSAPSQTAQALTPRFLTRSSLYNTSQLALSPVATITLRARISPPPDRVRVNGLFEKSTF